METIEQLILRLEEQLRLAKLLKQRMDEMYMNFGPMPPSPSIFRYPRTEPKRGSLTPSEQRVWDALTKKGLTIQQTAAELRISPKTVSHHKRVAEKKLNLSASKELP